MTAVMTARVVLGEPFTLDGIVESGQVLVSRLDVQFAEEFVGQLVGVHLRDAGFGIHEIAKDDRSVGTGLRAGRRDGAVGNDDPLGPGLRGLRLLHPGVLGGDLGGFDPLGAECALLHHASHPDGDLGIELHSTQRFTTALTQHVVVRLHLQESGRTQRLAAEVVEVVESTHLVRAVVGAVAGADAAVVDHCVEAVRGVHGRRDGTHLLARCVLALLTGHRLHRDGCRLIGVVSLGRLLEAEVPVDPEPVHLASAEDLVLADDRDVVLGLAGDHAGRATGAGVQIDRHSPAVLGAVELLGLPERKSVGGVVGIRDEVMVVVVGVDRRFAEQNGKSFRRALTTDRVDGEVVLHGRERIGRTDTDDLCAAGRPQIARRSEWIEVEPCTGADASGEAPAVAEGERGGVHGLTGLDEDRGFDGCISDGNRHHVARGDAERVGRRRSDDDRVVPGEPCDRIGKFLQPAVVRPTPVVDGIAAGEHQLDSVRTRLQVVRGGGDGGREGCGTDLRRLLGGGRALEQAVVQRRTPRRIESDRGVAFTLDGVEGPTDEIEAGGGVRSGDLGQQFNRRTPVEQRQDQRLADRVGAVPGPSIAPAFQLMGSIQMPGAVLGRLVEVGGEMDRVLDLRQRGCELEVGRSVEDGIASEHHERVDLAFAHGGGEIAHRRGLHRIRRQPGVRDRTAAAAGGIVDQCGQMMHDGGLGWSGQNGGCPPVRLDVLHDRIDLRSLDLGIRERGGERRVTGHPGGDSRSEHDDPGCGHRVAVIGDGSGGRQSGLHGDHPAHGAVVGGSASGPTLGQHQHVGVHPEEVAVEREDEVGSGQVVLRTESAAERGLESIDAVRVDERIPVDPGGLRELRSHLGLLGQDGGRTRRLGQDPEAFTLIAANRVEVRGRPGVPFLPARAGLLHALTGHRLTRSVGVVQVQNRGLTVSGRGAETSRMIGIAFDLGRTTVVARDQLADRDAVDLHDRGVGVGDSRSRSFGTLGVGKDVLLGPAAASGHAQAGQRHRGAHHLHEVATILLHELRSARGELAMQKGLELRSVREFIEAAPICPAGWALLQR